MELRGTNRPRKRQGVCLFWPSRREARETRKKPASFEAGLVIFCKAFYERWDLRRRELTNIAPRHVAPTARR